MSSDYGVLRLAEKLHISLILRMKCAVLSRLQVNSKKDVFPDFCRQTEKKEPFSIAMADGMD